MDNINVGDEVRVNQGKMLTNSYGMVGKVIGIAKIFGHTSVKVWLPKPNDRNYTETMPISWLTKIKEGKEDNG